MNKHETSCNNIICLLLSSFFEGSQAKVKVNFKQRQNDEPNRNLCWKNGAIEKPENTIKMMPECKEKYLVTRMR